jgi:hypothetical protein
MDVREKIVELLNKANSACVGTDCFEGCKFYMENDYLYKLMADVMIAHGVTVQEWHSASNPPKEDGTYLVQTNTGTITTARFYAFKSFPATKYLPACHRSSSWQSNRNVVKWTYLPQPPKGE